MLCNAALSKSTAIGARSNKCSKVKVFRTHFSKVEKKTKRKLAKIGPKMTEAELNQD